jgi:pyrroline-5-carboxylate reductase
MECMEKSGVALGLDADTSRLLTIQTALGAARMAMESRDSPALLRERVTSPGGTTERALGVFAEGSLQELFQRAMTAARDRSRELSVMLGGD